MKALRVEYNKDNDELEIIAGQTDEDWVAVCDQFDNDVERIRNADNQSPYTALYACFDEDNQPVYYLVVEDRQLKKIRHKAFLSKLGRST